MGRPLAPRPGNTSDLRGICHRVVLRGGGGPTSPTNASTRRHQHQDTQATYHRRTTLSQHDQAGNYAGPTGMDIDQDLQEQGTPPGTPFEEGFTPSTAIGLHLSGPHRRCPNRELLYPSVHRVSRNGPHQRQHQPASPDTRGQSRRKNGGCCDSGSDRI